MTHRLFTVQTRCRGCGSSDVHLAAIGIVIPWAVNNTRTKANLQCCSTCDLLFWDRGFTEAELGSIYGSYRSSEYQRRRSRWEPWYTATVNGSIGGDHEAEIRRDILGRELTKLTSSRGLDSPRRILDVGGDKGQFIPRLRDCEQAAIYEVSDAVPIEGVIKIETHDDCREFSADMIMICHVLEHVMDPSHQLELARSWLGAAGSGILYLEVPLDRPTRLPRRPCSRVRRTILKVAASSRVTFIFADFVSLVARSTCIPIVGPISKQSEHLNFWNRRSLTTLAGRSGFEVLHSFEYSVRGGRLAPDSTALGMFLASID